MNWKEINFKCEQCTRDIFLMHFNTPDSTSGQEHGACCQNMHHKMCGFMMDQYKFSCEEDKLKRGAERCSNNLYEFGYLSTVQKWTLNLGVVEEIHLRVGYTYIIARVNNPGNLLQIHSELLKSLTADVLGKILSLWGKLSKYSVAGEICHPLPYKIYWVATPMAMQS